MPETDEKRMTFGEHLDELRRRVLYALAGALVGFVACYVWFADYLLHVVVDPPVPRWRLFGRDVLVLDPIKIELTFSTPYSVFMTYLITSLVAGLILTSPWVLYHLWAFVSTGLYPRERRYVGTFGGASLLLFLCGVAFYYFVVYPISINFLYGFGAGFNAFQLQHYGDRVLIRNATLADSYVTFVMLLAFVFGLMFEMPLVVLFLGKTGLVRVSTFARYRKHVILAIVAVAAVVTPPDVFSQVALAVPMWALYELGILLLKLSGRREPPPAT